MGSPVIGEHMKSIVDNLKGRLESRGEYVVLANTSWFAIFPDTLRARVEQARADGRDGPNLIVYKTRSESPRDYHVVPYSIIRDLLVEETLSGSAAGGRRWNLTLDDGKLHVSHRAGKVDVARFRGLPLLVESSSISPEAVEPTDDPIELDKRVQRLLKLPSLPRPGGPQVPSKRSASSRIAYVRRPDVKAWVLREAGGKCELCLLPAAFVGDDGEPYFELHHVQQLAADGPDTVENAVALCAICHRRLHHGADRAEQRERLYKQVPRLLREDKGRG
jgi:hypothetical protein